MINSDSIILTISFVAGCLVAWIVNSQEYKDEW